ncbi:MAG: anti-phage protein KwaB [bacterium]
MNKTEELKTKLQTIVDLQAIGIQVFFIMKGDDGGVVKKANIANGATDGLRKAHLDNIGQLVSMMEEGLDGLTVLNLSAADDRKSAIYRYDLDDRPQFFDAFKEIEEHQYDDYFTKENGRFFDFSKDDLSQIDAFVILIGNDDNSIMIFRKNYSVNLFKRDRIYLIKESDTRFDTMKDDFIRLDAKIDFLYVNGEVYIYNLDVLERFGDFHQIITKEATASLEDIDTLGLVFNIDILSGRVDDLRFARKLAKISKDSPVFKVPQAAIIEFTKKHPFLKDKFKYTADGSQIELSSKLSQDNFIKLLNDDFLRSELTKIDYESPAKNRL